VCPAHRLQHARLLCPSPTAKACSNSSSLSWWCHSTISSCHPLLFLPSVFPSIGIFFKGSALRIRWPKYWSFSFSINIPNEYSGMIFCRIEWFDLTVQETLKTFLQHYSSKASILQHSAFFIVQLSHPYMTTRKTIALTTWTFVSKVMPLLFNMLSRLIIAFLPRIKHLNFMAAVTICSDFVAPQNKVTHCFHCFSIYLSWNDGTRCYDLSFSMLRFKQTFSLSSFTFIKRLFSSSSISAIRLVKYEYLKLLIFLPAILILACASSSPAFHMMYFACKLNKQGDNKQPWHTPFPVWNQSFIPCPVLTVATWPAYRFFRRQVRWSGIPISLRISHSLLCPHSQRLWHYQQSRSRCFSGTLYLFSMVQRRLAILSLVPLPFLNPAWISGSLPFMSCWSLAWEFLILLC